MADKYLRTSDGSDADDGSTWALAKASFTSALTVAAAGDNINFDSASTATTATSTTYTMPGTASSPIKVMSVSSSSNPQPPTTLQSGGVIETTGASSLLLHGSAYFHGMTLRSAVGANSSTAILRLNGADTSIQRYENCALVSASTGNAMMEIGLSSSGVEGLTILKNTSISFASVGSRLRCYQRMRWEGGEIASGSAAITNLFTTGSMGADVLVSGVDLSRGAAAMNLMESGIAQYGQIVFRNCKLPASWTGKLMGGDPLHAGFRAIMHNCSSGSTMYPIWEEDLNGKLVHEAVVVKQSGASDGSSGFAWKISSKASASFPAMPFNTPELPAKWNSVTGAPVTMAVDILWDSAAALTNTDVWLEVQYAGATDAKSDFATSRNANILATAAAIPDSSATWTTTGLTTPKRQRLQVTFTPQRAGYVQARVCVGKPTATIYVDPLLMVI